jgi:hypothetical protein
MADQKRESAGAKVAGPKVAEPDSSREVDPLDPLAEQAAEAPPERDRRGIALPRRHKVGGIITPQ